MYRFIHYFTVYIFLFTCNAYCMTVYSFFAYRICFDVSCMIILLALVFLLAMHAVPS